MWVVLVACGIFLGPVSATAGPKVDVVELKNGDHLTCEVKKLQQGVLTLSTDPLDKVKVHWGEVVRISSPSEFEVTLESGARLYGTLGMSQAAGELVVAAASAATVSLAEVTGIVPIGRSLWSRVDGNIDAGLSVAQANRETHYTINASGTYRSRKYGLSSSYASQLTSREDTERTLRNTLSLTGSRFYDNRWFGALIGQFQQNDELQLELRTVSGASIGRALTSTNHQAIAIYAGLVYTRESFVDQPVSNLAELAVGGKIDFFSPSNNDFNLTTSVVTFFSAGGRARLELQSAWRHEFLSDFYWSLNGVESFDSAPPDAQKKNDFSVSLSVGWKF